MKTNQPYINIHSHHPQEGDEISILNVRLDREGVSTDQYFSIGIHPWYITQFDINEKLNFIRSAITNKKVLAIGECGLDLLIDVPIKEQEQLFIEQIKIATKFKKPLIIHCVKAFNELIRIKKENNVSVPMIVHGFNNNEQTAEQLLKNNFYLSFGKALLISNSNAQKVFEKMEIKKLFLETDDSGISIKSIFDKASELKKIPIEELKEQIAINFKTIFNHE